jgi:hypothetical protein
MITLRFHRSGFVPISPHANRVRANPQSLNSRMALIESGEAVYEDWDHVKK